MKVAGALAEEGELDGLALHDPRSDGLGAAVAELTAALADGRGAARVVLDDEGETVRGRGRRGAGVREGEVGGPAAGGERLGVL